MVGGAAGCSPHVLAGDWEISFLWWKAFLAPFMDRFHIALCCSWSLGGVGLLLRGIRRGFSLAPLHPSLLLAGAPTSAREQIRGKET